MANLIPNPCAAVDLTSWEANSNASIARVTTVPGTSIPSPATTSLRIDADGCFMSDEIAFPEGVGPGDSLAWAVDLSPGETASGGGWDVDIDWYAGGSTSIFADVLNTAILDGWTHYEGTVEIPADVTGFDVYVTSTDLLSGYLYATNFFVEGAKVMPEAIGGVTIGGYAEGYAPPPVVAIGGVTIGGYAEGDAKVMPEAIGGVTIGGYAEGTDALPRDYPIAIGGVRIGGYARGSRVGAPELPPTDDIGWEPTITPPAMPKLTFSGVSLTGASAVIDCSIELSDHGGMMSATISTAVLGGGSKPALFTVVRVKFGGFSLFEGRVEHVAKTIGDTAGWTITCGGPMVVLRDHKAFRTVFVDSDLQNWQTDQGPRTSPDTFEVASRSSGAAV